MKKLLLLSILFFLITCGSPENCGTIGSTDGLVYKNEKLYTGKCAFYDDNNGGMISSHEFSNGKFNGKWKFFYPNGQLETKGNFDNGLRIGVWNYYHENGKKSQVSTYLNGEKHGVWKVYDENGNLKEKHEWKDGVAIVDSTKVDHSKTDYDIKIDGFDVKPITN